MKTYNEIDANAKRKQYYQNIKDVKNAKRRKMSIKNKRKKQNYCEKNKDSTLENIKKNMIYNTKH
jgi:hypothetical protein